MSKRKAQFLIDKDKEEEECLPEVGVVDTPQQIQERKILKIRGPKVREDNEKAKIFITAPKPTFEDVPQQQHTPVKFKPLNIFNTQTEKLFFNTQPLLRTLSLPSQSTASNGLISPTIVFSGVSGKVHQEKLSPIKESEEFGLFKNKLKWIKIDDEEHRDIELEVLKQGEVHTIVLDQIIKGIIVNNKIKKEDSRVFLECESNNKMHVISFEFSDEKDFELFIL